MRVTYLALWTIAQAGACAQKAREVSAPSSQAAAFRNPLPKVHDRPSETVGVQYFEPGQERREVLGGLSSVEVREAMARIRLEVAECYSRTLIKADAVPGDISLMLDVLGNGEIAEVVIMPERAKSMLGVCIVARVKRVRFPEVADGRASTVRQNFVFRENAPSSAPLSEQIDKALGR